MGRRGRRPLQNSANIGCFTVERTMYENKIFPRCKFFERGVGEESVMIALRQVMSLDMLRIVMIWLRQS